MRLFWWHAPKEQPRKKASPANVGTGNISEISRKKGDGFRHMIILHPAHISLSETTHIAKEAAFS
jgi:hypothetical protein